MSMKKIQKINARKIALRMATKAFEHILGPLQKAREDFAKNVYSATMSTLGLTPEYIQLLNDHNLMHDCADKYQECKIKIRRTDPDNMMDEITIKIGHTFQSWGEGINRGFDDQDEHDRVFPHIYTFDDLTVRSDALYDEALAHQETIAPHARKAQALMDTLVKQMTGRTCKEVMRDWPQAAMFVIKEMDLNNAPDPMMKPLEDLIGKFLPALAAPQGA